MFLLYSVLGLYLEPVPQKRSLFMFLTHPLTSDTCLLVLADPMMGRWRHLCWSNSASMIGRLYREQGFLRYPSLSIDFSYRSILTLPWRGRFYLFLFPGKVFCLCVFRFYSIGEIRIQAWYLSQSRSCSLLPGLQVRALSCLVPSLPYKHSVSSVKSECEFSFLGCL